MGQIQHRKLAMVLVNHQVPRPPCHVIVFFHPTYKLHLALFVILKSVLFSLLNSVRQAATFFLWVVNVCIPTQPDIPRCVMTMPSTSTYRTWCAVHTWEHDPIRADQNPDQIGADFFLSSHFCSKCNPELMMETNQKKRVRKAKHGPQRC